MSCVRFTSPAPFLGEDFVVERSTSSAIPTFSSVPPKEQPTIVIPVVEKPPTQESDDPFFVAVRALRKLIMEALKRKEPPETSVGTNPNITTFRVLDEHRKQLRRPPPPPPPVPGVKIWR